MKKLILLITMFLASSIWADVELIERDLENLITVFCIADQVVVMSPDGDLLQLMDRAGRMSGHFGTPTPMKCVDY